MDRLKNKNLILERGAFLCPEELNYSRRKV
jgi:hypothetical protein